MVSSLRKFTRLYPPIFLGSKVDGHPQDFLDEFCKNLFSMGVSTNEKAELSTYQLNTLLRHVTISGRIVGLYEVVP